MNQNARRFRPGRAGTLASLGALCVLVIAGHVMYVHRQVMRGSENNLALSLDVTADQVDAWYSARQSDAQLLARLLASGQGKDATFRVFAEQGGFDTAEVGDRKPARVSSRSADGPVVDFSAPVMRGFDTTAWVDLRTTIRAHMFPYLNPFAGVNRTGRTTLLTTQADSLVPLAIDPAPVRAMARLERAPSHVRDALAGARTHGVGPGLYGAEVVYASRPVPGTPWTLVREREVSEVRGLVFWSVVINESVLALLFALIAFTIDNRVRAGRVRRDAELARLRSDFVSSVSHELRTPLTQIRLYAEMLQQGRLPDVADSARALHVIEKEAERLTILVEKVLNFTGLRRSMPRTDAPPVDVAVAVREASAAVANLSAERGVSVVVAIDGSVQARIHREALQQVLINLLENAIKYGPRGQAITITASTTATIVTISVEDEGPGVPPAERESIWNAFQRGSGAEQSDEGGSGIGLAVVRDLVTQFGGTTFVEPARDDRSGARFVVRLAAAQSR